MSDSHDDRNYGPAPDADPIADEQIVATIAEHLLNVLDAITAAYPAIDSPRALRCASRALVMLDVLAAEEQGRSRMAGPEHGKAITALDMLAAALVTMRVKTPEQIEGFTLVEAFAPVLAAMRQAVEDHWSMLEKGGGPRLIIPGQNGQGA